MVPDRRTRHLNFRPCAASRRAGSGRPAEQDFHPANPDQVRQTSHAREAQSLVETEGGAVVPVRRHVEPAALARPPGRPTSWTSAAPIPCPAASGRTARSAMNPPSSTPSSTHHQRQGSRPTVARDPHPPVARPCGPDSGPGRPPCSRAPSRAPCRRSRPPAPGPAPGWPSDAAGRDYRTAAGSSGAERRGHGRRAATGTGDRGPAPAPSPLQQLGQRHEPETALAQAGQHLRQRLVRLPAAAVDVEHDDRARAAPASARRARCRPWWRGRSDRPDTTSQVTVGSWWSRTSSMTWRVPLAEGRSEGHRVTAVTGQRRLGLVDLLADAGAPSLVMCGWSYE